MGSGISEAMGSVDSIKNTMGGGDGSNFPTSSMPTGMMGALTPGTMSGGPKAPGKLGQFGRKALKNGLTGASQGLQQQAQGGQRGGGGVMPEYIQGAMLPQIPGQSQQQVLPYGVKPYGTNNPFFGG